MSEIITSNYSLDQIKKLDILNAVINEVIRLHPIGVQLERKAIRDHNIGEMKILKGTVLQSMWLGNHYNERYFSNPDQFIPERWLDPKLQ